MSSSLLRTSALILIFVLALAASAGIAVFILQDFPNSADEYAYLFQAKTFLDGVLWYPYFPDEELFDFWHILSKEGKLLSKYPPGWPALLAFGMFLKIPSWLVNPLLGALTLLVTFLLGKRFYGEKPAWVAVISVLCSSFFLFNAGSYFSHTSCGLLLITFTYFFLVFLEEEKPWQGILAGALFGMAFLTRFYTAFVFLFPLLIHRRFYSLKRLRWIVLGGLPFLGIHLFYNHAITGNALLMPFQWYDPTDMLFSKTYGYSFEKAWEGVRELIASYHQWINPMLCSFFVFYLVMAIKQKTVKASDLMPLALLIGYAFHWTTGYNQYGPRYYYEAYPLLAVSASAFVFKLSSKRIRYTMMALLGLGLGVSLLQIPKHLQKEAEVIRQRKDVYTLAKENRLENAIVILTSGTGALRYMGPKDLTRNDPKRQNSVLYVRDKVRSVGQIRYLFPNREIYRYTRQKRAAKGSLEKVFPT